MRPCHHGLARPQVADGGTASNMEGSCECISVMEYLLTAIGLTPGGSSTVHIYTQTIHRTIRNKQYIEQHNNKDI